MYELYCLSGPERTDEKQCIKILLRRRRPLAGNGQLKVIGSRGGGGGGGGDEGVENE